MFIINFLIRLLSTYDPVCYRCHIVTTVSCLLFPSGPLLCLEILHLEEYNTKQCSRVQDKYDMVHAQHFIHMYMLIKSNKVCSHYVTLVQVSSSTTQLTVCRTCVCVQSVNIHSSYLSHIKCIV